MIDIVVLLKPLFDLLLANLFFAVLALLLILGLSRTKRAAYAVLKRLFFTRLFFKSHRLRVSVFVRLADIDGRILAP